MSEQDRCPNGSSDCEFDLAHELTLSGKIMGMIGRYNQEEHINPCPVCLRDTMLAVAALLHLESIRLHGAKPEKPRAGGKRRLDVTFAKAARERLQAVMEAHPIGMTGQKH
jgi:hypothetical protein